MVSTQFAANIDANNVVMNPDAIASRAIFLPHPAFAASGL